MSTDSQIPPLPQDDPLLKSGEYELPPIGNLDTKVERVPIIRDIAIYSPLSQVAAENQAYLRVLSEMRLSTIRRNEEEIIASFLGSFAENFHFPKVWYGSFNANTQAIFPVIHCGAKADLIDDTFFYLKQGEGNAFPICKAIAENKCLIVTDLTQSHEFLPWRSMAREGNFHSLVVRPFEVNDRIEGGMAFYYEADSVPPSVMGYMDSALVELSRILSERRLWEEQKRLLKWAREKAEQAAEAKSRFLANMSHEIRTPMTAILGYTEALADKEIPHQKVEDIIRIIRNNSEYLLHILNDILDYSKIESEMLKAEMSTFSLEYFLSEINAIFSVLAKEKGLEFSIRNTTPFPVTIFSDHIRLKQIMLNLIGNACKFTEKGSVEILVSWTGDKALEFGQLRIDVKDTGKGIAKEALTKIFNPFEQEDTSITRRYEGTGLGLAISQRLATLLCGTLTVESEPGKGSCFSVFLPQQIQSSTFWSKHINLENNMEQAQKTVSAKENFHQVLQGCRILLVEDGIDNQRLFSMILRKAGIEVTLAGNGQIGVEALEKSQADGQPFDLILMDMQMPVMDGLTATKVIREKGFDKPIIVLTAHAMQEERDRCTAAGCTDFLTKPILRDALLSAIARNYNAGEKK